MIATNSCLGCNMRPTLKFAVPDPREWQVIAAFFRIRQQIPASYSPAAESACDTPTYECGKRAKYVTSSQIKMCHKDQISALGGPARVQLRVPLVSAPSVKPAYSRREGRSGFQTDTLARGLRSHIWMASQPGASSIAVGC